MESSTMYKKEITMVSSCFGVNDKPKQTLPREISTNKIVTITKLILAETIIHLAVS